MKEEILSECDSKQETLNQREQELNRTWVNIWKPLGINPLSPKEMISWLAEIDKLRYKVGEIQKKEQEIDRDRKRREDLTESYLMATACGGDPTPPRTLSGTETNRNS